jgi:hypothetical protein
MVRRNRKLNYARKSKKLPKLIVFIVLCIGSGLLCQLLLMMAWSYYYSRPAWLAYLSQTYAENLGKARLEIGVPGGSVVVLQIGPAVVNPTQFPGPQRIASGYWLVQNGTEGFGRTWLWPTAKMIDQQYILYFQSFGYPKGIAVDPKTGKLPLLLSTAGYVPTRSIRMLAIGVPVWILVALLLILARSSYIVVCIAIRGRTARQGSPVIL